MRKILLTVLACVFAAALLTISSSAQLPLTGSALSDGSTTAYLVKSTGGGVWSLQITTTLATAPYVRLYNTATLPNCGSATGIISRFIIPAGATGAGASFSLTIGKQFSSGIGVCLTANVTDTDNTAVASGSTAWNVDYR